MSWLVCAASPSGATSRRRHRARVAAKRPRHPEVGELELHCQVLYDVGQSQGLLVFTALPGSDSHAKLALLGVIGRQQVSREPAPEQ